MGTHRDSADGEKVGHRRWRRLGAASGLLLVAVALLLPLRAMGGFHVCVAAGSYSATGAAETSCGSEISVSAVARLTPSSLPSTVAAPASLRIGFTSEAADGTAPELSRIELDIARNVELHTAGLASCSFAELYSVVESPGHTCAKALVGRGVVESEVALPGKSPVPVRGRASAFYVKRKEGRFILVRVITHAPLSLIYVIPFKIAKGPGPFGTSLAVRRMHFITGICIRPDCSSPYTLKGVYSHISRLELSLHRRFHHGATKGSFLNARCPAPSKARPSLLAAVSLSYGVGPPVVPVKVFDDCRAEQ